jgi:prevent-host-death family protein
MKAVSLAIARTKFSEIVTSAEQRKERVVIEKRNKPAAVLLSYEDYKKLEALEEIFESRLYEEKLKRDKVASLDELSKRVRVDL